MFNNGKGFRRYSAATHNIVTDGNSIAAYVGSSISGQGLATTIQNLPVMQGSGITVQGFATGGHAFDAANTTINDMLGGIDAVKTAYVPGKFNIFIFDEFTNQVYGENNTANQTIDFMMAYLDDFKASGINWDHIMVPTTIPRGVNDPKNLILVQVDNLLRTRHRSYGIHQIIDRRQNGSPWNLSGYTQADFDAISQYITPTERSVALGGNNLNTHPSDAGYALQRPLLDMAFRRVGYRK